MKQKSHFLTLILLTIGLLLPGALTNTACTSPNAAAYNILKTGDVTFAAAMDGWNQYLIANPTTPMTTRSKVKAAFERVKSSELIVADAGKMTASNNTNGTALTTTDFAVQTAGAFNDLITLLKQCGVKL